MEFAIMVEGQNGLNWPRWMRIAKAVEDLGFAGLYRSDHYTNANPPDLDSLEMWVSLTWLASHTKRLEFGPLVTPVSFRHPSMTARMAAAVDDLSGGRLVLGLGAGWQEREHSIFGRDLLDLRRRFDRFEEGLVVISKLLTSDDPVNFKGTYYKLNGAILLPRPNRPGGPPILIGGNGLNRTLSLAAKYATEWNANFIAIDKFVQLNEALNEKLRKKGKARESLRRSLMTGCVFGKNPSEVERKIKARTKGKYNKSELRKRGTIVGVAEEINQQLTDLEEAGVQRVMLQWLDLDDLDSLEAMARSIIR